MIGTGFKQEQDAKGVNSPPGEKVRTHVLLRLSETAQAVWYVVCFATLERGIHVCVNLCTTFWVKQRKIWHSCYPVFQPLLIIHSLLKKKKEKILDKR